MLTTLIIAASLAPSSLPLAAPPGPAAPDQCTISALPFWGNNVIAGASWRDNSSDESGFELEWKTSEPKNHAVLTVAPDAAGAIFAVVRTGTVSCRVRAFNAAGKSAWSNWTTVHLQ